MLILVKNGEVYAPEPLGQKDILITAGRIGYIQDCIDIGEGVEIERIEAKDKFLVPGFIDSHVHILGGGGEGGFQTRAPEIMLSEMTTAGITTVVGCLGTDGTTRTIGSLLAKARGLEEEGITSFIYTGSYQVPVKTMTGSVQDDIVLINKIIGVGEIALSDHRSSQPTVEEVTKVAAAARIGGMLSGKAGIVHVHIGDGDRKLEFLQHIAENTEIPITQFLPTHVNRNRDLFEMAIAYAKSGGLVDLTTSAPPGKGAIRGSEALKIMLSKGVPAENVSFSSDGQGSLPVFNEEGEYLGFEIGRVSTLFEEVKDAIRQRGLPMETALRVITSNPAKNLKLRAKGNVQVGKDADIVLLDKDLEIDTVMAKGQIMVKNKELTVRGVFED